jgi:hypothetical protein
MGYSTTLPLNPRTPTVGVYTTGPSAELYDPVLGAWFPTKNMLWDRAVHTATLLHDGRVLVAGGHDANTDKPLASAEVYDPAADSWRLTMMNAAHTVHTATLMPDGAVLVVGGGSLDGSDQVDSAEWYHPATGAWTSVTSMRTTRSFHVASLLPDGRVLVAGGRSHGGSSVALAEVFHA